MKLTEKKGDLFELAPKGAFFAHCISADFALGAGIAVQFDRLFGLRRGLRERFTVNDSSKVGTCLPVGRVFNLVTKEKCWQKPTYESLKASLIDMRRIIDVANAVRAHDESDLIDLLRMPRIGCGLDRLEWGKVRPIIEEVFGGYGDFFEIEVYYLN